MNSKLLSTVDRIIAVFALCMSGFGWGLIYLVAPLFGALILAILAALFLFRLIAWNNLTLTKQHAFSECFRLMRKNPILPVRVEWIILLAATVTTVLALSYTVLDF